MTHELIRVAIEENSKGTMIHLVDMPGAFTRAKKLDDAIKKVINEAKMYKKWVGNDNEHIEYNVEIVQQDITNAYLDDGDSEILVFTDKELISTSFNKLKKLAVKSAKDFQSLYDSIPDKEYSDITKINKKTFLDKVPANANEMLSHVDEVKVYYLDRINIPFPKENGDFISNRNTAIELLESSPEALTNKVFHKDNEYWTTVKVLRRFIWHDRIHARALYRFAVKEWGYKTINNSFNFKFDS